MKKIGYLGVGVWGYCLASLLASKGYEVIAWSIEEELIRLKRVRVLDMITHRLGLSEASTGFKMVSEAGESVKVVLDHRR